MSSRKPSKPGGTSVTRTSTNASSSTRLPTLDKRSSTHRPGGGTALRTDLDNKMATRQLKYTTLSGKVLQDQEKWAQKRLEQTKCSMGFQWVREIGGYRCSPPRTLGEGNHFVTDELLAEGQGRQYYKLDEGSLTARLLLPDGSIWSGPYPIPDTSGERYRESERQIRIDSSGRIWEASGGFHFYTMRPDPRTLARVRWKQI